MTIRELLEECRESMHTVLVIQRRREELAMSLLPHSITLRRIDVQTSGKDDPLSVYAAQAYDMDRKLARQQEQILEKHRIADRYISTLPRETWKQALTIYYMTFRRYDREIVYQSGAKKTVSVRGLHTWETTAEALGKNPKTIYRMLQELNQNFMKRVVNVSLKK